jgi:hypothetical protein
LKQAEATSVASFKQRNSGNSEKNKHGKIVIMRGILMLSITLGSLLFANCIKAQTGSATISWNPSSTPNVASYQIYYGTSSGNYISAVPVSSSSTSVTIYGLMKGVKYYFAATAFDSSGNQSSFSPEISGVVGSTLSSAAALASSLASAPGQFSFAVSGMANYKYVVQASTDLVNWVALQTNVAPFNFVDSNRSQFSQRYYRVAYNPNW